MWRVTQVGIVLALIGLVIALIGVQQVNTNRVIDVLKDESRETRTAIREASQAQSSAVERLSSTVKDQSEETRTAVRGGTDEMSREISRLYQLLLIRTEPLLTPTPAPTMTPLPTPTLTPTPIPAASRVSISQPKDKAEVEWRNAIEGDAALVPGATISVLVWPMEAQGPWYVQANPFVFPDGRWRVYGYFGGEPDVYPEHAGTHYMIVALVTEKPLVPGPTFQELPSNLAKSQFVEVTRK